MKADTTSIAKDDRSRAAPLETDSRAPSDGGRAFVWRNRLASVALLTVVAGSGYLLLDRLTVWYGDRVAVHQVTSTLFAMRARERQYARQNEAFAGSIEELKMQLPLEVRAGVRVAAGPFAGRPDFLAEYCHAGLCRSIDAKGTIRLGVEIVQPPARAQKPLEEGPGRYFSYKASQIR